jgi:fucose permease
VRGGRLLDRMSAWLLIVLGAFLLSTGLVGLIGAARDGDWRSFLVAAVLMVVFGLGVLRGVSQLRRIRAADAADQP